METRGCSTLGEQCRLGRQWQGASLELALAGSGLLHLDMAEDPANPWHVYTTMNPVGIREPTGPLILPSMILDLIRWSQKLSSTCWSNTNAPPTEDNS